MGNISEGTNIDGVIIKKIEVHSHDRGNFKELLRDDDNLLKKFGQASLTITYPNIIKAFHYHKKQDDLWYIVSGNAQIVLYDLRKNSKTYKKTMTIFAGDLSEPILVLIPKGVAHGYKVLGNKECMLLYFTTESYDRKNPDEYRIPYNDKDINYNWDTKYR